MSFAEAVGVNVVGAGAVGPEGVEGRAGAQASAGSLSRLSDYRREFSALPDPGLTKREIEVLTEWLGAESKQQAAEVLFISAATVSTHLARIRAKYASVGREAPTKTHLFARALQDGYTSLDRW